MINTIAAKFNKIVYDCCERFAQSEKVEISETQLLFSLSYDIDPKGKVAYHLMKGYNRHKEVTFLQVLNVRFDVRGYAVFVPPFIQEKIEAYAIELKAEPKDVTIICIPAAEKSVALCLYNGKNFIKQIVLTEEF